MMSINAASKILVVLRELLTTVKLGLRTVQGSRAVRPPLHHTQTAWPWERDGQGL